MKNLRQVSHSKLKWSRLLDYDVGYRRPSVGFRRKQICSVFQAAARTCTMARIATYAPIANPTNCNSARGLGVVSAFNALREIYFLARPIFDRLTGLTAPREFPSPNFLAISLRAAA